MKNKGVILLAAILLLSSHLGFSQHLKAGIDKDELLEVMYVSARTGGNDKYVNHKEHPIPAPSKFERIYRSQTIAFDNLWELWSDNNGTAILTVRGSTAKNKSWLANFYAVMLPAKGELLHQGTSSLSYHFADNPNAAVHAGWTISTSFLYQDIKPKIDSIYQSGTHDIILTGHSQGGAICYLLTAQVLHDQKHGKLPKDIHFKTFCTAAPRVGNLYFAYDYEQITKEGWAYNIVNPLDWVPEMPLDVQTTEDFNAINPFAKVDEQFKKQKLPARIAMKRFYKRLKKHPEKALRSYQKILGDKLKSSVNAAIGEITLPDLYPSMQYVRSGQHVVLTPSETYMKDFPSNPDKIFVHHSHHAYIALINEIEE